MTTQQIRKITRAVQTKKRASASLLRASITARIRTMRSVSPKFQSKEIGPSLPASQHGSKRRPDAVENPP